MSAPMGNFSIKTERSYLIQHVAHKKPDAQQRQAWVKTPKMGDMTTKRLYCNR
jgi:hypothetical protein